MWLAISRTGSPTIVRPHIPADDYVLTYGILVGPELFGQGFIDEHYPGRSGGIVFGEVAAARLDGAPGT